MANIFLLREISWETKILLWETIVNGCRDKSPDASDQMTHYATVEVCSARTTEIELGVKYYIFISIEVQ